MCFALFVHFTECETRRLVVLNPLSGDVCYHPTEHPPKCAHHDPNSTASRCRSHGSCCRLELYKLCLKSRAGQSCLGFYVYHQIFKPSDAHLFKIPEQATAQDSQLRTPGTESLQYMQLRRTLFDTGALVWYWRHVADLLMKHVEKYPYGPDAPTPDYTRAHNEWQEAVARLEYLKIAWDREAQANTMEPCLITDYLRYPLWEIIQFSPKAHIGFPVLNGEVSVQLTKTTGAGFMPRQPGPVAAQNPFILPGQGNPVSDMNPFGIPAQDANMQARTREAGENSAFLRALVPGHQLIQRSTSNPSSSLGPMLTLTEAIGLIPTQAEPNMPMADEMTAFVPNLAPMGTNDELPTAFQGLTGHDPLGITFQETNWGEMNWNLDLGGIQAGNLEGVQPMPNPFPNLDMSVPPIQPVVGRVPTQQELKDDARCLCPGHCPVHSVQH